VDWFANGAAKLGDSSCSMLTIKQFNFIHRETGNTNVGISELFETQSELQLPTSGGIMNGSLFS
jgi:hypothetical protein